MTILLTFIIIVFLTSKTFATDSNFDPMVYDTNEDDVIDIEEVAHAVNDYKWNEISKQEVIEVYKCYFGVK